MPLMTFPEERTAGTSISLYSAVFPRNSEEGLRVVVNEHPVPNVPMGRPIIVNFSSFICLFLLLTAEHLL